MKFKIVFLAIAVCCAYAKRFSSSEFGYLLRAHGVPELQLPQWQCIAYFASNYESNTLKNLNHGIFQIHEDYWCAPQAKVEGCSMTCDSLRDDDISNDIICAQKIFAYHKKHDGNGFFGWKKLPCFDL